MPALLRHQSEKETHVEVVFFGCRDRTTAAMFCCIARSLTCGDQQKEMSHQHTERRRHIPETIVNCDWSQVRWWRGRPIGWKILL